MFSHRQFIAFRLALITVVAAAIVAPLPSRAATRLVELPTSAHGWRPIPVPAGAARSDVIRRLARADRALVHLALVQVVGARRGRATLRDEAFVLSSPHAAARLTRARAGPRSSRVAVGRDGHVVLAPGVASIIWREGARVGLLILRERASAGALPRTAIEVARFADGALRARQPSDSLAARARRDRRPRSRQPLNRSGRVLARLRPTPERADAARTSRTDSVRDARGAVGALVCATAVSRPARRDRPAPRRRDGRRPRRGGLGIRRGYPVRAERVLPRGRRQIGRPPTRVTSRDHSASSSSSAPRPSLHSPIEPPHFDQLQPEGLKPVWAHTVGAAPYTTSQYEIRPLPHVRLIHIAIDGPARLLTGGAEDRDLQDAWFCVQGEDCRCPPDAAGSVPPTRPLSQPAYLGVTGDPDIGTAGVVDAETLAQFCRPNRHQPGPHPRPRPRPAPPGPLGCAAGCGSSNGDPHMHPFSADPYEFQAAGEFTLVRSNTGTLEIQTRQLPWGHTRDLSVNTPIALRIGRSTVEFDAGRSMGLIVDHRRRALPRHPLALRGGGRLRVLAPFDSGSGNAAELVWPDGSRARVWPIEDFGIAILVAPARSLGGKLVGFLGNLGGSPSAPFVGRDGRQYPADLITGDSPTSSAARYGAFGESWRVRQRGSLFTYPRGKRTGSYTVRGFPFDQYDLSGAPAAQRAQAEQLCRSAGISDPAALADCIVDVLGTGDRRFADASIALQRSAGRGTLRSSHPWTKLSSLDDSADPLNGMNVVARPAPGGGLGAPTCCPARSPTALGRAPCSPPTA